MIKISFLFKTCIQSQTDIFDDISMEDWQALCKAIESQEKRPNDFIKVGKTIFRLDELIFARIITKNKFCYKFLFKTGITRRFYSEDFEALHKKLDKESPLGFLVTPTLIIATQEVAIAHYFE